MSDFLSALDERVVVADGAMGTMPQSADLSLDDFDGFEGRAGFGAGHQAAHARAHPVRVLEGRYEDCVEIARAQTRDGAHLLDLCVDCVGRDGVADMGELAGRLATASTLPIMLDSTEPEVIWAGPEQLHHPEAKYSNT